MHGLRVCLALWIAACLAQARGVSLRGAPVKPLRQTAKQTGCPGSVEYCPPECGSPMPPDPCACPLVHGFPGMEYLGRAVDMKKYHSDLVDSLTEGKAHMLEECILPDSYMSQVPDFSLRFYETIGTEVCEYVRPNTTALPQYIGIDQVSSDLSVSAFSKASSMSLGVGFAASDGLVSISEAFSMKDGNSSSGSFSGSADSGAVMWQLNLQPEAPFNADILKGLGDYDGSVAARLSYESLFRRVGFYFVTQVTTGGNFKLMQTVTKTASANSSQYAFDWVAFLSGGGYKHDSFHRNSHTSVAAVGGDYEAAARLLAYLPMIEKGTVDRKYWQEDYGNWLASIPATPILIGFKVDHIRNWIKPTNTTKWMPGGDANPILDNLRLAYDELESGLHADRLTLLRIQYGLKEDFDKQAVDAQFIELPTELKNLPSNLPDNTGFSTQYDPQHSCPSAMSGARNYFLGRTLRYTEHCDSTTNLIACGGHPWCDLLTNSNMGMTADKALNAELWMRVVFVAGAGNEIQTIDFKPCGYGAVWAVYWNEHQPYSHNRTRQAKVVGPYYSSVEGGGKAQQLSDAALDLFPCTADNSMGGFADGTDPACCDTLSANESYIASQEVGCPAYCSQQGRCVFPPEGPLHCE